MRVYGIRVDETRTSGRLGKLPLDILDTAKRIFVSRAEYKKDCNIKG